MVMKNIIIGTAGWRMKYGNSHKILSTEEISALIHHLKSINIRSFDTASNYGDAENILFTQLGKNNFVDTKLESFSDLNVFKKLLAQKTKLPINVLYFHDPKVFEKFSKKQKNELSIIYDYEFIPRYRSFKSFKKIPFRYDWND